MPVTLGKAATLLSHLQRYIIELNTLRAAENFSRLDGLEWKEIGVAAHVSYENGMSQPSADRTATLKLRSPVLPGQPEEEYTITGRTINHLVTYDIRTPEISGNHIHILDRQPSATVKIAFNIQRNPPTVQYRSSTLSTHTMVPYYHQFAALVSYYEQLRETLITAYDSLLEVGYSHEQILETRISALGEEVAHALNALFLMGTGAGKTLVVSEALVSAGGEGFIVVPDNLKAQVLKELRGSVNPQLIHVGDFADVKNKPLAERQRFYHDNNIIVVGFGELEQALERDQDGTPILNESIVFIDEVHEIFRDDLVVGSQEWLEMQKLQGLFRTLRNHNLDIGLTGTLTEALLHFYGDPTVTFMMDELLHLDEMVNRPRWPEVRAEVIEDTGPESRVMHALAIALGSITFLHPEANWDLREGEAPIYHDPWAGKGEGEGPTAQEIIACMRQNISQPVQGDMQYFIFSDEDTAPLVMQAINDLAAGDNAFGQERIEQLSGMIADLQSRLMIAEYIRLLYPKSSYLSRKDRNEISIPLETLRIERDEVNTRVFLGDKDITDDLGAEVIGQLVVDPQTIKPGELMRNGARSALARAKTIENVAKATKSGYEDVAKQVRRKHLDRFLRDHRIEQDTDLVVRPEDITDEELRQECTFATLLRKDEKDFEAATGAMDRGRLQYIVTEGPKVGAKGIDRQSARGVIDIATPCLAVGDGGDVVTIGQQGGRSGRARTCQEVAANWNLVRADQLHGEPGIDRPWLYADVIRPDFLELQKRMFEARGRGGQIAV